MKEKMLSDEEFLTRYVECVMYPEDILEDLNLSLEDLIKGYLRDRTLAYREYLTEEYDLLDLEDEEGLE